LGGKNEDGDNDEGTNEAEEAESFDKKDFTVNDKAIETHPHEGKNGEGFSLNVRLVVVTVPSKSEENRVDEECHPWKGDAENTRERMTQDFATGIESREITKRRQPQRIHITEIKSFVTQVRRITESNDRKNNDCAVLFHRGTLTSFIYRIAHSPWDNKKLPSGNSPLRGMRLLYHDRDQI
jgi:hypothetical protein